MKSPNAAFSHFSDRTYLLPFAVVSESAVCVDRSVQERKSVNNILKIIILAYDEEFADAGH